MLLPQRLPQPNKSATDHVGDLLRQAAEQAKRDQGKRKAVTPLSQALQSYLQPAPLPELPQYGKPPSLQSPRTYEANNTLGRLFGKESINPLDLSFEAMQKRGQAPGQADFARANVLGDTAAAQSTLSALFPNGFEATPHEPLSLPGIGPRRTPQFPDRPAPATDTLGSILAGIAGFVDPVGAGNYNAEPLRAAANVANQQFEDRKDQFGYDVQTAANEVNDARAEREAQFEAAIRNQSQGNLLREFDARRQDKFAGLTGEAAGGQAYGDALLPLAARGQAATQGNALDSFVNEFIQNSLKDTSLRNDAELGNWRNAFDLGKTQHDDAMNRYNAGERSRNNSLDLLGSLLRPQFDPLLSDRQRLLNSQANVNKAREKDLLTGGGTGGDPEAMRLRALNTAIRIATNGGDPSEFGLPAMPGVMGATQVQYQQRATALQMRDPRIRQSEDDFKARATQRDILLRRHLDIDPQEKPQAYARSLDSLTRADRETFTAMQKRDKQIETLSTPPRTPGVSTQAPPKMKTTPRPPSAPARSAPKKVAPKQTPTMQTSDKPKAKATGGRARFVYDPATGNFR